MGVASERAVSIPQITYEHIDDSEKKDVSFFVEEPREPNEGKTLERALLSGYCNVQLTAQSSTS